jgi:glycosyltransferase involved in cell wall biosynthesis
MEISYKKKILLYSDCYLFGGSEYVIVNILKNKVLNNKYNFYFAYREHKIYNDALNRIFLDEEREHFYPLKLFCNLNLFIKINQIIRPNLLKILLKMPFYFLDKIGLYDLWNKVMLSRLLRRVSPDLLSINNGGYPGAKTCLQLALIAKRCQLHSIMQINNLAEKTNSDKQRKIDNMVNMAVQRFVTGSKYAKKQLSHNRMIPSEKINVIHNVVQKPVVTKSRAEILKSLGIPVNKILLIEVALLQERKGQLKLLEALVGMRENNTSLFSNIVLLLIGTGENELAIKKYIRDHSLDEKVILLGYRFDYVDYLNSADVVLLPSLKDEDMPLIILTAMLLKKSIVATNIAGIPEEIENNVSGYLLDPSEERFVDSIQIAIEEAIRNKERLGENAYNKFVLEFSNEGYTKSLLNLYSECI